MEKRSFSRRRFLKQILSATLTAGLQPLPCSFGATPAKPSFEHLPWRVLGKTQEMVSILGLSGTHLAHMGNENKAVALVREAMKISGKTVVDLVWEADRAAQRVAKALAGGDRKKLFLVTGTDQLSKQACLLQLKETLQRLGTDKIDLWMVKESIFEAGPDKVFSLDGAIGAVLTAQEKGMVKHAGFAGYRNTEFMMAAMEGFFDFRAAEIPMNGIGARYTEIQKKVMPHMLARSIGMIVSNPLMGGVAGPYPLTPAQILSLMWSQLVSAVAAGVDSIEVFRAYIDIARHYKTTPRPLRRQMLEKLSQMLPQPEPAPSPLMNQKYDI